MISLHEALAVVAASDQHRILQRLPALPTEPVQGDVRRGLYVDVETTGLDTSVDEVIEFGAVPFLFSLDGRRIQSVPPLHFYNEPRKNITEEITKLTGITAEMVAGKAIVVSDIEGILESTDIVIAHNAEFDRPMLERISTKFKDKHWGCSMTQVPWGTATRKLEYLLSMLGYFYDAHNAVTDCQAGLFAITQPLGETGLTGLSHILEASRAKCYRVWAIDAPYDKTGKLQGVFKERSYRWNNGDNGLPKAWNKELHGSDTAALEKAADDEEIWLKANTFPKTIRFDRITAKERFTKRG